MQLCSHVTAVVSVALLGISLIVPLVRGNNSYKDECLKQCDNYQTFLQRIMKEWASEAAECRRRCLNSAFPIPNGVNEPGSNKATRTTLWATTTRLPTTTTAATTTTVTTTTTASTTTSTTPKPTTTPTTTTTSTTPKPTTTTTTTTTSTTTSTTPKPTTTPTTTTTSTTTSTTPKPTTTKATTTTTTSTTAAPNLKCGIQREGVHKHRQRVIGGFQADWCEYPWMVLVTAVTNICGGAILDEYHVLTAAHCVKDRLINEVYDPSFVYARAGSSSISQTQEFRVVNVTTHPLHDPVNKVYDVAVVTLAEKIVFNQCIGPICLPEVGSYPKSSDNCNIAGWGVIDATSLRVQPQLQEVEAPIVNQENCQASYGTSRVNELTFCAGDFYNGGRDSCQGDSGGPLMCKINGRFVVHGIVSSGWGCALAMYPGIYTRVAHPQIMQFIQMATRTS